MTEPTPTPPRQTEIYLAGARGGGVRLGSPVGPLGVVRGPMDERPVGPEAA